MMPLASNLGLLQIGLDSRLWYPPHKRKGCSEKRKRPPKRIITFWRESPPIHMQHTISNSSRGPCIAVFSRESSRILIGLDSRLVFSWRNSLCNSLHNRPPCGFTPQDFLGELFIASSPTLIRSRGGLASRPNGLVSRLGGGVARLTDHRGNEQSDFFLTRTTLLHLWNAKSAKILVDKLK